MVKNPWEEIKLDDYENHMKLDSVYQLQTMNKIMKEQFYTYTINSVMILGIAGGNGLEHIDPKYFSTVYGVDINQNYLDECCKRYINLQDVFQPIHADLINDVTHLPKSDLLIANLLIEYIGYECFQKAVSRVHPRYVSCVIQINTDTTFVSDSPYLHVFDDLDQVHTQIEEDHLIRSMMGIGYTLELQAEEDLPNGKKLVRLDFKQ